LFLVPALLPSASAAATSTLASWSDEDTIANTQLLTDNHQTAMTSTGRTVTVWENRKRTSTPGIYAAIREGGSDTWGPPSRLNLHASEFSLVSYGKRVTLIWRNWLASNETRIYSQTLAANGHWLPRQTVTTFSGGDPFELGMAAGASRAGIVATWTRFGRFFAAYKPQGQPWGAPAPIVGSQHWANYEGTVGLQRAFVTGSGRATLVFFERTHPNVGGGGPIIFATRHLDGTWTSQHVTPDTNGQRANDRRGMAVDINYRGDVVVAWAARNLADGGYQILTRSRHEGEPWGAIEQAASQGEQPDVGLGPVGGVNLAYVKQNGDLDTAFLARKIGTSGWTTQQVGQSFDAPYDFASTVLIDVNSVGDALVGVQPSAYGKAIRVARCPAGSACGRVHNLPHTSGQRHYYTLNAIEGEAVAVWQHGCGTEECLAQSIRGSVMTPAA